MMSTGMKVFFRIIRDEPASLADFASARDLGKPMRDPAMQREWAEGMSVFDSLPHTISRAKAARWRLGRFAVPVCVPDDGSIEVKQTGNDPHHFTIYVTGERGLAMICGAVVAVEEL